MMKGSTGQGSTDHDTATSLCLECASLDLESRLFGGDIERRIVLPKERILACAKQEPCCSLSQFFYEVLMADVQALKEEGIDQAAMINAGDTASREYTLEMSIPLASSNQPLFSYELKRESCPERPLLRFWIHRLLPVMNPSSDEAVQTAPMGRRITEHVNWAVVRDWLAACGRWHGPRCTVSHDSTETRLPIGFRVIDCLTRATIPWNYRGDFSEGRKQSLTDSKETGLSEDTYVALSYVWGTNRDSATMLSSSTGLPRAIELPIPLPLTIEDSITTCLRLGFRYLWVDRYCIPQDDPVVQQVQISAMDSIYWESTLTIIAAAGEDPSHGLPGVSSRERLPQPQLTFSKGRALVRCAEVVKYLEDSKWYSRAWTFQEGLLSRRRLVFTDSQAYFHCQEDHQLESINESLAKPREKSFFDEKIWDPIVANVSPVLFQGLLCAYLGRNLTFERDILNAFWGILNRVAGISAVDRTLEESNNVICEQERSFRILMGGLPLGIVDHPRSGVLVRQPQRQNQCHDSGNTSYMAVSGAYDVLELVDGLLWAGFQSFPNPNIRRRDGFPSWSWTGWKIDHCVLSSFAARLGSAFPMWAFPLRTQEQRVEAKKEMGFLSRAGIPDFAVTHENAIGPTIDVLIQGEPSFELLMSEENKSERQLLIPWTECILPMTSSGEKIFSSAHIPVLQVCGPCIEVQVPKYSPSCPQSDDKIGIVGQIDWSQVIPRADHAGMDRQTSFEDNAKAGEGAEEGENMVYCFTILALLQHSLANYATFKRQGLNMDSPVEVDMLILVRKGRVASSNTGRRSTQEADQVLMTRLVPWQTRFDQKDKPMLVEAGNSFTERTGWRRKMVRIQ